VALKKPEVWVYVQLGNNLPTIVLPPFRTDVGDAVDHKHLIDWELGIAGTKEVSHTTGNKFFLGISGLCNVWRGCHKESGLEGQTAAVQE
jgi:hypothetical protein